ncbi:MAG: tetraacyldisaccharide 4'-kinase [Chitinophagales bacterium]|nr:tetraacyldisaccharide 4'-kinase [Chitinophagales bacterium]
MKIHQILWIPFAFLYSLFIRIWLWMYQKGYSGKVSFTVPIISIGNIQAGGTGKTPLIAYLCEILSEKYQVAVISRGYKRNTLGFRLAGKSDTYKEIGDEPYWLNKKFPNVAIAVAENRIEAVPHLMSYRYNTQVILLDDGFQQLGIRLAKNILLTPYHSPFTKDFMLPVGRLREPKSGSERADIIVITKCPVSLLDQKEKVLSELNIQLLSHQKAFLSSIVYTSPYLMFYEGMVESLHIDEQILLVTGIADTLPLLEYLKPKVKYVKHLSFLDHYKYRESDIRRIENEYYTLSQNGKTRIITTEKDAVRLEIFKDLLEDLDLEIYIQAMSIKWDDEESFINELI